MKIILIGSGNVAHHLANAFTQNGVEVAQIFGRNKVELEKISQDFSIPFSTEILGDADVYFVCVRDSAIGEVSEIIQKKDCIVAHTSGAVSRETLRGSYSKAVFYPLQTFSKNKILDYSAIPFFIDTDNEESQKIIASLARKISNKVALANDEKRKYIHLTAVFACNFTNHLYARAKEIADQQEIPFDYFLPLIDETTQKIHEMSPKIAQTGPAIRNDLSVLKAHQELIHDPDVLKIYTTLNHSIKKMYEL
ncbi:MAG: DUF2520 domain-containing protein [Bacteroidetes bacterium]|nr:DUF2520 domain-containing protein [Bacteroidota bacterium]